MASVIDAVRNFTNDKTFILKLIILFVPILLLYFMGSELEKFPYLLFGIAYFYIGYMIVTFHTTLKERDIYFPNPITSLLEIIIRGFIGMICISPITAAAFFGILYFENMDTIAQIKYLAIIFAILVWFSVAMVQLILYSKEYSPFEAFNLKVIFDVGGEFLINILKFIVQSLFFIGLPAYIAYLAGASAFADDLKSLVIFQYSLYAFTTLIFYLVSIDVFLQIYEELIITEDDEEFLKL